MKKQNTQAISIAAMTALLMAASGADVMAQANCSTDQSQPVLPRNGSSVSGHGCV